MQISRYVDGLREEFLAIADIGGPEVLDMAQRLVSSLDARARLMIFEALSDAAAEITSELAPGSVEVRVRGRDAELVVSQPPTEASFAAAERVVIDDVEHVGVEQSAESVRTTIRLPEHIKDRVDEAARAGGVSVNTWLVRAVTAGLDGVGRRAPAPSRSTSMGQSFTGWVR